MGSLGINAKLAVGHFPTQYRLLLLIGDILAKFYQRLVIGHRGVSISQYQK
jgi:hypothetical protein